MSKKRLIHYIVIGDHINVITNHKSHKSHTSHTSWANHVIRYRKKEAFSAAIRLSSSLGIEVAVHQISRTRSQKKKVKTWICKAPGRASCKVCGAPIAGKIAPYGNGVAHQECAEQMVIVEEIMAEILEEEAAESAAKQFSE